MAARPLRPLAGEQHSAPRGPDDVGSAVGPPTPAPASPPRPGSLRHLPGEGSPAEWTGGGGRRSDRPPHAAPTWSRSPERGRRGEGNRGRWGGWRERGAVNKELPLCEVRGRVQSSRLPGGPRSGRQPTREPSGSGAPGPTFRLTTGPFRIRRRGRNSGRRGLPSRAGLALSWGCAEPRAWGPRHPQGRGGSRPIPVSGRGARGSAPGRHRSPLWVPRRSPPVRRSDSTPSARAGNRRPKGPGQRLGWGARGRRPMPTPRLGPAPD